MTSKLTIKALILLTWRVFYVDVNVMSFMKMTWLETLDLQKNSISISNVQILLSEPQSF